MELKSNLVAPKSFALNAGLRALIAQFFLVLVIIGPAQAREDKGNDPYSIGLWGDLPYSDAQATIGVPNLIDDMNKQKLAFSVHDGDLKAGSNSPCDDALYERSLEYFNTLQAPAMFTPGDNDWTDCDRASNGGYNSLERLNHEREVFFSTPYSLGGHPIRQDVQALYVENRRWTVGKITYATLNVQGSCNNLCDTAPDPDEYADRNAANIEWMKETFVNAKENGSVAVMFISQANPGWDQSDKTRAPLRDPKTLKETDGQPDGYQEFLLALRDEVIAFERPVAYVHGDSHYFRIDKPFLNNKGQRIENFTRVETFGDNASNGTNDVNWLKVIVNPREREVFSYQPQIVPGNRVAVQAP
jgi:hypothetical protein